ncbi:MAG TPA: methylmalonyl Co-A mutase-associated GTPase MeaB, partial [Propionibacteriaceae bacterium]|nr:methylmalonyl Co-A mutase-associated GTPase MeaB [Propionibacteriaceae bacterium]
RGAARELAIAMRLITSDPKARRPPVLTSSSYTGKGLDEVWQAVLDHRAYLEDHGGIEGRRNVQQEEWLWSLVDDALLDGLKRSEKVRALRAGVEASVRSGELSALEGSELILDAFVADVPTIWPSST